MANQSAPQPTVSVMIPAYNAGPFIQETVNSLLQQSFTDWECIIANDASTDDTWPKAVEVVGSDPRFKLFNNERNLGMEGNWNFCLKHVTGRYIVKLDADDLWEPEYLSSCVRVLDSEPDTALVFTHMTTFGPNDPGMVGLWPSAPPNLQKQDGRMSGLELLGWIVEHGNFIPSPSVMWRAALVAEAGPFDETVIHCTDMEMWLRLAMFGYARCLARPLVRYRVHPDQITMSEGRSGIAFWHGVDGKQHALDAYRKRGLIDERTYVEQRDRLRKDLQRHFMRQPELTLSWADGSNNLGFRSEQTITVGVQQDRGARYEFRVPLKPGDQLRFLTRHCVGVVRIASIELQDEQGTVLAQWATPERFGQIRFTANILLIPDDGRFAFVSAVDEPQLYLDIQGALSGPTDARVAITLEYLASDQLVGPLVMRALQTQQQLQTELAQLRQAAAAPLRLA